MTRIIKLGTNEPDLLLAVDELADDRLLFLLHRRKKN